MPRGDVLGVVALHEDRDAAGDLDVLDAAPQLRPRSRRSVLPHSFVMVRASSSRFSSIRCLSLKSG